ncbi:hypothetical protein LCGC14_0513450 [marine sediment metagenome]|uniref:Haloacid dehalogenase-like hydrolase n=1 Tax=marine sediment metagenome TaxID=412755 RepID=A0A0F9S0M2_9ZZZZ
MIKSKVKIIVFDFDGVIIESNKLKYDAFFSIFAADYKNIIKAVLTKHREESRHSIIKQILIELKKNASSQIDDIDQEVLFYSEKYNNIVEQRAVTCNEIRGAEIALKILSTQYPLFINSSTPLQPLRRILAKRGILNYFKNVYGGPKSKIENLSEILEEEDKSEGDVLVVGDGWSDLNSAQQKGCLFIGIHNEFNKFIKNNSFIVLKDLVKLPKLAKSINIKS